MSRTQELDKVLDSVRIFSKDLAPISDSELSFNTGIDIDLLVEYLDELQNRGFINHYENGSYITLKGRMALENAEKGKPFQEELDNKKLKKIWSVVKIIAGVLNALAIIGIAIWAQSSSVEKNSLTAIQTLTETYQKEKDKQKSKVDSLKTVIRDLRKNKMIDSPQINKEKK